MWKTVAIVFLACASARKHSYHSGPLGAGCNGVSTPGPENTHPILTAVPKLVSKVENGSHYTISQGDQEADLIHVYGRPYDWGFAHGTLMKDKLLKFFPEVYEYMETQVSNNNGTVYKWVEKVGLEAALALSFDATKDYIQPYVLEEIQGMADAVGLPAKTIRDVMWIPELTRGSCSMFGAWGDATKSRDGKLLQLRALDWDIDGPFKNYAAIIVYHPSEEEDGHAFANVAFTGFTGSVTGMSSQPLALSEIGVSYPDASFGKERYLAPGTPFAFLIRDILQFDKTLADADKRVTQSKRTCDLILGVGDGNSNSFHGYQFSPSVANVFTDTNLMPVENWHPRINDVVYWGMDWICPNDNTMLSHQLNAFHGNITAENTIRHITSYVQTGDVHIAIYDHSASLMYVSYAAKTGTPGPKESYARPFMKLDMKTIFAEPKPSVAAHAATCVAPGQQCLICTNCPSCCSGTCLPSGICV
jgi:hypothetical protein